MRLEGYGSLCAPFRDDALADAGENGYEERQYAHVGDVEERVRHCDMATGRFAREGIALSAEIHQMVECRSACALGVC